MTSPRSRSPRGRVFFDSSAFLATLNLADEHHEEARGILARIATEHLAGVTTNFVIAEAHALILTRMNRSAAMDFLHGMERSEIQVIRVQESDETGARKIVYQYDDKNFSLTDAISFAVTDRLGIGVAFAFDRNFVQYGFEVIRP